MDNKPYSNPPLPEDESDHSHVHAGRDHIVIQGDVGAGANVGSGINSIDYVAGGDMVVNNGQELAAKESEFVQHMSELRRYVVEAHKSGEINERVARKVVENLNETAKLATETKPPPKNEILRKLQYVADVLDTAVDMIGNGPGSILIKALPVAALLIKIATRIF